MDNDDTQKMTILKNQWCGIKHSYKRNRITNWILKFADDIRIVSAVRTAKDCAKTTGRSDYLVAVVKGMANVVQHQ